MRLDAATFRSFRAPTVEEFRAADSTCVVVAQYHHQIAFPQLKRPYVSIETFAPITHRRVVSA
jgi:hypothetical protein